MTNETTTPANESLFSIGEVARREGVCPRRLSDLFYKGRLSARRCPLIGGRRVVPESYLPEIHEYLADAGLIPATTQNGDSGAAGAP